MAKTKGRTLPFTKREYNACDKSGGVDKKRSEWRIPPDPPFPLFINISIGVGGVHQLND